MSNKDIIAGAAFLLLDSAWKQFHEAGKQSPSSKQGLYTAIRYTQTGNGLLRDASVEVSRLLEVVGPLKRIFSVKKIQECGKITTAAEMWAEVFSARVNQHYAGEVLKSNYQFMKTLKKPTNYSVSSGRAQPEVALSVDDEQAAKEWADAILASHHEANMDTAKEALAAYPDVLRRVMRLVESEERRKMLLAEEEETRRGTLKEIEQYGEFAYRSISFLMNCLPNKNPIYEKH
jgi:hypothetical protein